MMKITLLGTSSGKPTKSRHVSATCVSFAHSKQWILVDCGEATQFQLLKTSFSLQYLSMICITHVHGDHCYGLPGLLSSAAMNGRIKPLLIICPIAIKQMLDAIEKATQFFINFPIIYHFIEEGLSYPHDLCNISIIPLSHRVPSYAFYFQLKLTLRKVNKQKLTELNIAPGPLWGQLQRGESITLEGKLIQSDELTEVKCTTYAAIIAGDNDKPDCLAEIIASKPDVLLHEATYTEPYRLKALSYQHSSAEIVAKFAEQAGIPNLILTHFSSRFTYSDSPNISEVKDEARRFYHGNLYLANDFDQFTLDKRQLTLTSLRPWKKTHVMD